MKRISRQLKNNNQKVTDIEKNSFEMRLNLSNFPKRYNFPVVKFNRAEMKRNTLEGVRV